VHQAEVPDDTGVESFLLPDSVVGPGDDSWVQEEIYQHEETASDPWADAKADRINDGHAEPIGVVCADISFRDESGILFPIKINNVPFWVANADRIRSRQDCTGPAEVLRGLAVWVLREADVDLQGDAEEGQPEVVFGVELRVDSQQLEEGETGVKDSGVK
jgi:hypothetical protein